MATATASGASHTAWQLVRQDQAHGNISQRSWAQSQMTCWFSLLFQNPQGVCFSEEHLAKYAYASDVYYVFYILKPTGCLMVVISAIQLPEAGYSVVLC